MTSPCIERSRRFLVVLAMLVAWPRPARADDALARQYFRHGVELYDKKQYQPALAQFRSAYSEKPVPGIKQNIALCLKGLGRPVEAATAFDEALDEGAATLKPETRAAMEKELADLAKVVATVRLKILSAADKSPIDTTSVTLTVDGVALSPAAGKRPLRLEPGIHVFTAHADGLADPPEKKLSILAGSPVDATFELGAAAGVLTIRPNVVEAAIAIDGAEVGRGVWSGKLSAGTHRVSVSAPQYQTTTADVVVSSGASVEYPIAMFHPGDGPPEYKAPLRKPPPKVKSRYLAPSLAYEGESFRLGTVLGEQAGGTKRAFSGASFGVRGGIRVSKYFAIEAVGEIGQLTASYTIGGSSNTPETTLKVTHWQLMPMARFATTGPVRFMLGSGLGVHDLSLSGATHTSGVNSVEHSGSGVSVAWLLDSGMQFDAGPLWLEAAAFLDVHGVGSAKDNTTDERFFYASPGTRAGLRATLGIPF